MQNDGYVNPFEDVRKKVQALKDRIRDANKRDSNLQDEKNRQEEKLLRENDK
jgi:hypothetical protein